MFNDIKMGQGKIGMGTGTRIFKVKAPWGPRQGTMQFYI